MKKLVWFICFSLPFLILHQSIIFAEIGFGVHFNPYLFLFPNQITKNPTTKSETKEFSLLNGLDGLGIKGNFGFGLDFNYEINQKIRINTSLDYSKLISRTPYYGKISCTEISTSPVGKSESILQLIQIPFSLNYFFAKKTNNEKSVIDFFMEPLLSINFFYVETKNVGSINNSDTLFFAKNYFRVGLGLFFGARFALNKRFYFEGLVGIETPNAIFMKSDDISTLESEALILDNSSNQEKFIGILSTKIRLTYRW